MKLSLTTCMLLGLVFGCIAGLAVSEMGITPSYFKPLGDLFITLIRMIVVPLVFTTIVAGAASVGDVNRLGRIAGKTLIFYFATTAVAATIGIIVANIFGLGLGLNLTDLANESGATKLKDFAPPSLLAVFMGIVPLNPVKALTDGNMLQIIFFALLLGISLSAIGEKGKPALVFFESLAEGMLKLTKLVMYYSPIGVFGLMAYTIGMHGIQVLIPLMKLIVLMALACTLHVAIVYMPCVRLAGVGPKSFFKAMAEPLLIAFSSASSAAALSTNLIQVEKLGGHKSVASFTIPLGNTINMDGTAIYMGLAAIFAANIYNIPMPINTQIMVIIMSVLASIGSMGVPGAGLIMISMVFVQIGIPLEAIALIAGVDRILDAFRTSANVLGDATAALVVSKSEKLSVPVDPSLL